MRARPAAAATLVLGLLLASRGLADDSEIRKERVSFEKGASSATLEGKIRGYEIVDYLVGASAGQTIAVSLQGSNGSNYFNVLPPGSTDVAMHVGQDGQPYTGTLPDDGDWVVRVYLMRNAARRNETSDYELTISVTGKPLPPLPASEDAMNPGTRFHATSSIPCLPMPFGDAGEQTCEVGVVRRGHDGTGTVVIRSGSFVRRILFVALQPVAADTFQAMTSTREEDVTTVKFDDGESYRIFDALLTGG